MARSPIYPWVLNGILVVVALVWLADFVVRIRFPDRAADPYAGVLMTALLGGGVLFSLYKGGKNGP